MSDNCGSTQNSGDRLKGLHKRSADDFRTPSASRNSMLDVPVAAGPEEAPLMEAVDNLGDFLRFVEWSTRSEISSRGPKHAASTKLRGALPDPNCDRTHE
jgi:hypothetical protein